MFYVLKPSYFHVAGNAPSIVAKGGFSGLFPDSSFDAYNLVSLTSSSDTILWCDVQLTKDGVGVCIPNVKLDNCTSIAYIYPAGQSNYIVNGVNTTGWFSVDYTMKDLSNVSCKC